MFFIYALFSFTCGCLYYNIIILQWLFLKKKEQLVNRIASNIFFILLFDIVK